MLDDRVKKKNVGKNNLLNGNGETRTELEN